MSVLDQHGVEVQATGRSDPRSTSRHRKLVNAFVQNHHLIRLVCHLLFAARAV